MGAPFILRILLLLCGLTAYAAVAETPDAALAELALGLRGAPSDLRAELARSALLELSLTYREEAERARADLRSAPQGADLRRWLAAVEGLATEHAALAATITPATPIALGVGPDGIVQLAVAGTPVMLSGPRPQEQAALEQRILAHYCSFNLCDPAALAAVSGTALPASPPGASMPVDAAGTHWSFSAAGPICASGDGLEFQFENTESLRQRRIACATLVAELQRLAEALTRQAVAGVDIDWNALVIVTTGEDEMQTLVLNTRGA
ncbi:MAG: hypothetical protein WCZ87_08785, partial [Thiohalobacteraceae bacterium]